MTGYIAKRLLAMIPTLFGITVVVFFVINLAPGSPVEQKIRALRMGGANTGAQGVSQEVVDALNRQYGFDKPAHVRYLIWLKNIVKLDFGDSFTFEEPVLSVIASKFEVSLLFGVTSFLLTYLICIPLGILKAIKKDEVFDVVTSSVLFVLYSVPPFMLALLLITFFASNSFLDLFPIGGLVSDNYDEMSIAAKIWDRVVHAVLPLTCYIIGNFATLTILMKNSLLEEIPKEYIRTARAKGLSKTKVYLKHALKNALIPIATGIGGFVSVFFTGSLLLETIFQLDGIGLLSYNSILSRDYNVIMGLVSIQSLLFLIGNLISDLAYVWLDPRIDFN